MSTEILKVQLDVVKKTLQNSIIAGQELLHGITDQTSVEELLVEVAKLTAVNKRFANQAERYYEEVSQIEVDEIEEYTNFQLNADEIIAKLNVKISLLGKSEQKAAPSNSGNLEITSKLPQLSLPTFDGDILKWHQFWDQFSSNVDTRNISDVDKLLYLQRALVGEAREAVEGLETTNKNYKIAIDTLKERYGKTSAIIDAHYVALYRIKIADKTIKGCRMVLNEIERHLRILNSLGEDVNHNHLRVMIMEKFPEDLIYELRMKMTGEIETIDNIRKYLEYIISARETSNRITLDVNQGLTKDDKEHFSIETLHTASQNRFENRRFRDNKSGHFYKSGMISRKRPWEGARNSNKSFKPIKKTCLFCDKDHFNDECTTAKSIAERKRILRNKCFNCFVSGHRASNCQSKRKCYHCQKFGDHNRALCPTLEKRMPTETNTLSCHQHRYQTILQTAVVQAYNPRDDNQKVKCRILLDSGSQRSYITPRCVDILHLKPIEETRLSIFTFGSKKPQEIDSPVVELNIVTRTNVVSTIYANVVPYITHQLQSPHDLVSQFGLTRKFSQKLTMADDGSKGDQIDILLGNDCYHSFMLGQIEEISPGLYLVNSKFGWIWSGRPTKQQPEPDQLSVLTYFQTDLNCSLICHNPDPPLRNDHLINLWDLESIGIVDSPKSTRDDEAIRQFNEHVQYITKRYHVTWPWIDYPPVLPTNFGLSYGRLVSLVKRLNRETLQKYDVVFKEHLSAGIIERVPEPTKREEHLVHYLPHHCVCKENSSTKLRVVYDASAKTKTSNSLNDCLYRGPLMLTDLTGLIIRFRTHNVGLTADVEKAFLQIGLQNPDRDVTRFLWLKDLEKNVTEENLLHFRFCRVPFGVISSPFLLNATIKHHLTKWAKRFVSGIIDDIYVDNLLSGSSTVAEAISLYTSCQAAFDDMSMNLREWNSNSSTFLSQLPDNQRSKEHFNVNVLGLNWKLSDDSFGLKYIWDDMALEANSKRAILRFVASLFDPCGFAVPVILPLKLLLQELWTQKVTWDAPLSQENRIQWQRLATRCKLIAELRLSRFYGRSLVPWDSKFIPSDLSFELHCFTDASPKAYAAVVYLRILLQDQYCVSFVIGKSRLAPIKDKKVLQIPRLELLGVLIGRRLIDFANKTLKLPIKTHTLWTDSKVVLSWCKTERLLPPFVSRRVAEIKTHSNLHLKYVPSALNTADVATRFPTESTSNFQHESWIKGPSFLNLGECDWPSHIKQHSFDGTSSSACVVFEAEGSFEEYPNSKTEPKEVIPTKNLTLQTSELTENVIEQQNDKVDTNAIRQLQAEYFSKEVQGEKTDLARNLKLCKDQDGLLRCQGRFQNAAWIEGNYPILLPSNTELTNQIIEHFHTKNYHVGVSHTLSLIRLKYWIPKGRMQVQRIIRKCERCKKYGGGPYKLPEMPPLPAERVNYCRAFQYTGMDYLGPVVQRGDAAINKCWICLFTCLSVRAVHLEIVNDLTANECVMAIRRFVAIRGLPNLIISDNALYFKLTAEVFKSDYCITNKLNWKFIPERAPWFGGFYERLVSLVKHCLKRTLDKQLLTNIQLCTIIKEIETVLNLRPLTVVGNELEHILKPADFLYVQSPILMETSAKEFLKSATSTKIKLIDSWKRGQCIVQEFVKMFVSQYLTSLINRRTLHKQPRTVVNKIPNIGDIVQIKSDLNRAHWKVGKIINVITGADNNIRVAQVEVKPGEIYTRSISHLYPLETDDSEPISIEPPGDSSLSNPLDPVTTEWRSPPSEKSDSSEPFKYNNRTRRMAAVQAQQKIKEWTAQLLLNTLLFEN